MQGLDPKRFLHDHWQRQPLFLREALPGFEAPLTPEELAGLACEPDVESRLVLQRGGEHPWEVRHGPFLPKEFSELGEQGWSLLVHGVDRFVDEVAALLDPFRFLPNWRIDDVMVSYAPPGGSVGAHLDAYDVFLLQGTGTRRWSIESEPRGPLDRALVDDVDVELLKTFDPDQSWRCAPGDLLYLPPGHAHHGVAVDACTTYSIGFRAPSHDEAVEAWLGELAGRSHDATRATDRTRSPSHDPGHLDIDLVAEIATACRQATARDPERWVGSFLTRPRSGEVELYDLEALDEPAPELEPFTALRRSAPSHFAYREHGKEIDLYVGGRCLPRPHDDLDFVRLLCGREPLGQERLRPFLAEPSRARLLARLVSAGFLSPVE